MSTVVPKKAAGKEGRNARSSAGKYLGSLSASITAGLKTRSRKREIIQGDFDDSEGGGGEEVICRE